MTITLSHKCCVSMIVPVTIEYHWPAGEHGRRRAYSKNTQTRIFRISTGNAGRNGFFCQRPKHRVHTRTQPSGHARTLALSGSFSMAFAINSNARSSFPLCSGTMMFAQVHTEQIKKKSAWKKKRNAEEGERTFEHQAWCRRKSEASVVGDMGRFVRQVR